MDDLNYLRIAQILGGTLTEIEPPAFGVFGAASASAERFRLSSRATKDVQSVASSDNVLIAAAFERVRRGFEVDRVLVDPQLYKEFMTAVRASGVKSPEPAINRRLQAFRKSPRYGVKLSATTQKAGLDPEAFFYAAEFGYVQLTYRRRINVDDIVTDPQVGDEFVAVCQQIEPKGQAIDFKWAALQLRKMRSFSQTRLKRFRVLDVPEIEKTLKLVGTLDEISLQDVPMETGVFCLSESSDTEKYLYIGATSHLPLRNVVEPFRSAKPFTALAGPFWQPKLADIAIRVSPMKSRGLFGASPRDLSLRLIEERHPLFNMPVHLAMIDEAA